MIEIMRMNRIGSCLILAIFGTSLLLVSGASSPSRFGKSDLTIYSADVDPLNIGPGIITYPDYYDPVEYRDQVTTIDFSEDVPDEGDIVWINLTVFNIGLGSGSGEVSFYDGPKEWGDLIGSDHVTVDPLNYDTATTTWDTFGIGTEEHEIFAYIDPEDPENETNDENNAGSQEILVNFYPKAEITSITGQGGTIYEGDEVAFDASGSNDTQRDLEAGLAYTWHFNDPNSNTTNPDDVKTNEKVVRHVFQDAGTYAVDLRVTDQHGAGRNDSATLMVGNRPPVPIITLPGSAFEEDSPIPMSATAIDSIFDLTSMEYEWDLGDGSRSGWSKNSTITHSYPRSGDYSIVLTARDDEGASSSTAVSIRIENVEPEATIKNVRVNGISIRDPLDGIVAIEDDRIDVDVEATDTPSDRPNIGFMWDLNGDGIGSNGTVSFSIPKKGAYTLTSNVVDDDGGIGTAELSIDVDNVPPTADAGPDIVLETDLVVLNASRSSDTPTDMSTLEYHWDLGGGVTKEGMAVIHSFGRKGTFDVVLTVEDDDGERSIDDIAVTIKNVAPRVEVSAPQEVREDEVFPLDTAGSLDPDGEIRSIEWTFEDHSRRHGARIEHVFHRSGPQRISVIVRDDLGAATVREIVIDVVNVDPIAIAGEDNETLVGWPLILDGSLSNDTPSDRRNLTFIWDVPGSVQYIGERVEIVLTVSGTYEVILTVVDDDGRSAVDRLFLIVRNLTLTSVDIKIDLLPGRCGPDDDVTIHGWIAFRFLEREGALNVSLTTIWIMVHDRIYRTTPTSDGRFTYQFRAPNTPGRYPIIVRSDRFGMTGEDSKVLTVEEGRPWVIGVASSPAVIAIGATAAIILIAGGATLSTDIGRWKFLLLMVPLFSRLSRDRVLENFARGRIYQYIIMNPGDHFTHIKEMLDLNIGTLTYHLTVLEREEFIKSRTDGMYKRFYPYGMKVDGEHYDIQELILMHLYKNPGMTQKELASVIGVHVSTVNYHVNMMVGAGLLTHYKKGQVQRYLVQSLPTVIPEAI